MADLNSVLASPVFWVIIIFALILMARAKPKQVKQEKKLPEGIKLLAALSYFGGFIVLPLLLGRKNQFVRFHLKQGAVFFVLFAAVFSVGIVLNLPEIYATHIAIPLAIGIGLVDIFAMFQASQGRYWQIPGFKKLTKN